jgi:peroxiredoxin Q/BCP
VSPDSVESHRKFKATNDLPFTLLADTEHKVAEAYDVWIEKSNYGRKYMGVNRSTFLIDAKGTVATAMRGVRAAGHAADVLAAL